MNDSPEVALDNDLLIKAAAYRLTSSFWQGPPVGVLGAARFLGADALAKRKLRGDIAAAQEELRAFIDAAVLLEPSTPEAALAAEIEVAAQRAGLQVDGGESQLAAMVMERDLAFLETGDKRAIEGMERLRGGPTRLERLDGRVRCLEQVVGRAIADGTQFDVTARAICAEPDADKTLSFCFSCTSPPPPLREHVDEGLTSYLGALRRDAPNLLAAD